MVRRLQSSDIDLTVYGLGKMTCSAGASFTEGTDPLIDTTLSIQDKCRLTSLLPFPPIAIMSSPPDIKPVTQGTVARTHGSRPTAKPDKKPVVPGDNASRSIDFTRDLDSMQKEHERLDERYHLQKSNLNLQMEVTRMKEENRRLREGRVPAVKAEAGLVDVKPDVSRLSRGGRSRGIAKDTGMPSVKENDDDDIIFIRETRNGRPKRITEDSKTSQSPNQRQDSRRLSHQVAIPSTPEPAVPIPEVHAAEVSLVLVPATPESISSADRQIPSESALGGPKRSTTTASNHCAEQSKTSKKAPKQRTSSSLCGSSGPEPETDVEDESYARPSSEVSLRETLSMKRKKLRHQRHDEPKVQDDDQRQAALKDLRKILEKTTPQFYDKAKGYPTSRFDPRKHATLPSSSDDETKGPYRGPHLAVLSMSSIKERLTRGYRKHGLAEIDELASWWPKTIVAKHHGFSAGHSLLLSWGVYSWWSDLSKEVRSPTYIWSRGLGASKRKVLMSKVREIALQKKAAAVRAERIMDSSGDKMPSTSVIRLSN